MISVLSSSPPYGTLPIVQVRYSSCNSDHVATLLSLSQLLPRSRDLSALQNLSSATLPSSTSSHCVSTSSHLLFLPLGLPCFGSPYGWLLHVTQDSAPSSSPLKAFQQSICSGTHCLSQPCHSILFYLLPSSLSDVILVFVYLFTMCSLHAYLSSTRIYTPGKQLSCFPTESSAPRSTVETLQIFFE